MRLETTSHPERPELDMSFSAELLADVAAGRAPETIRIFRPGATVAFGRLDSRLSGFERARAVAAAHHHLPLLRLAGGHAVAYDSGSVIVEVIRRHERSFTGVERRFEELAELVLEASGGLGIELEAGELPDEYCPGRFSLHLADGPKVAGIAQRVLARASLTTAVIAVQNGAALRSLTTEIYAALGLPLSPKTVGTLDEHHPGLTAASVEAAFRRRATGTGRRSRSSAGGITRPR